MACILFNFQKVAQCPHGPIPASRARPLSLASLCLSSLARQVADFAGTLEAVLSALSPGTLHGFPASLALLSLFAAGVALNSLLFRHLGLAGAAAPPLIPLSQVKRADRPSGARLASLSKCLHSQLIFHDSCLVVLLYFYTS